MPTITHSARATIGGSTQDAPAPSRPQIKAPTGMGMPPLKDSKPQDPSQPGQAPSEAKTGQSNISEETTPPAVTLSPQLTALARKQQKLQQEIQAQRDKEAQWAKTQADFVPKSAFRDKLQKNVAEALQDLGTNYAEITNLQLSQLEGADPVQEIRSELQQLKKTQEESVNKQYEATLKQYRAEIDSAVSADPKSYHFINKGKHQDAVLQHIIETWQDNPDMVLTVDQAAKEIEDFLREQAQQAAASLKELEPPEETPAQEKKLPPPRTGAPRTLTQQVEATPTRIYNQFQHLSMKERIAQAIARAQK